MWLSITGFSWHLNHINIYKFVPPDLLVNQLYHSGSEYISLKTIVAIFSHLSSRGIVYHLLFSGIVTIFGLSIYLIAKEKYSDRIAAMSSMIAMLQAYILLSIGNFDYSLLSLIALPVIILICSWLHPKHGKSYYLLLGLTLGLLFCVPYFWAMLIFAAVMARSRLKVLFKHINLTKKIFLIAPSLFSIALSTTYSVRRADYHWLVGNIQNLETKPSKLLDGAVEAIKRLLVDFDPSTSPKLPLIGLALVLFSILSFYLYIQGFSSIQQKILPAICLGAFALTVLGLSSMYFIILAGVIIMSINGVAMLLQQWFTVFPKNPFARFSGIAILTICVLVFVATQVISYIELTKMS